MCEHEWLNKENKDDEFVICPYCEEDVENPYWIDPDAYCGTCAGSGEGMSGGICRICRGSGVMRGQGECTDFDCSWGEYR